MLWNGLTDRLTGTRTRQLRNPRCACVPRVNRKENVISIQLLTIFLNFNLFYPNKKDKTSTPKLHYEHGPSQHDLKYIKILTSAPPVPPIVSFDSSTASTDSEKVLLFNKFFHSVFTVSAYQVPPLHESASPTLLITPQLPGVP